MRVKMQIVAYGGVELYKMGLTLRNSFHIKNH